MKIEIAKTSDEAGKLTSKHSATIINNAIKEKGHARILLSTGASQFPFFDNILSHSIDWSKVDMFHLDEYVGITADHPASFQKYLKARFIDKVNLRSATLISGEGDPKKTIEEISRKITVEPIDLGLIGIGENAHIAFNDPPADFFDESAYKVVLLAQRCREQQFKEGWFNSIEDVYKYAISMTCKQIMKCKTIISLVPYKVKAQAVFDTIKNDVNPNIPATLLKTHADFTLYCDEESAALIKEYV